LELSDKHLIATLEYIGMGEYIANMEGEIEFARAIEKAKQ
jgi:hypothetical protein